MPHAPFTWVCLFSLSIPSVPSHSTLIMVVFWGKQSWQVTGAVLCGADGMVGSAHSGRSYFPLLGEWTASPQLPGRAVAQRVLCGVAGQAPRGLAAPDPSGALLPALLLCDLEFSLLPQPLTQSTPQLAGLLFNVTFSRLCLTVLQLRNWLRFFFLVQFRVCWGFFLIAKAIGSGQNCKSLSASSNSPLWLPISVTRLFTPASCNSAQHLMLPHQSSFIYAKLHFPSLLPSVFQVSQLWSWAAGRWQHSISWGSWQPASAWSSTGNGNSELTRCFVLPGRCSASVWCCNQRPAGRIHLVMSRTDAGRWAQPLGSPGSLLVLNWSCSFGVVGQNIPVSCICWCFAGRAELLLAMCDSCLNPIDT